MNTQFDYDYQPALQDPLSTVESGLSKNDVVDVKAGDMVYDSSGAAVKLEKGVKVFDADGNEVEYDGTSPLKMKQLTSTYKFKDYTWSDGTKGSIEDFKLAYKIDCDKESGATTFETCDQIQKVDFGTGLEYTVTWLPGSQNSLYFLAPIGQYNGPYPSHQVLADGRKLADVPAKEWATLPEIAEKPLSYGPYMLTEWKKGESMTFEVNPHYQPAPDAQEDHHRHRPGHQPGGCAASERRRRLPGEGDPGRRRRGPDRSRSCRGREGQGGVHPPARPGSTSTSTCSPSRIIWRPGFAEKPGLQI